MRLPYSSLGLLTVMVLRPEGIGEARPALRWSDTAIIQQNHIRFAGFAMGQRLTPNPLRPPLSPPPDSIPTPAPGRTCLLVASFVAAKTTVPMPSERVPAYQSPSAIASWPHAPLPPPAPPGRALAVLGTHRWLADNK